jgi:RNA polymerase sigma-70 factor (ECF subfamily)
MDDNIDYIELVKKAQLGDKDSLNRLAEVGKVRLSEYVERLTLQDDLTQDIVQESILEMLKVFDQLKKADRFWGWLYGIAFNKVRSHYGKQWRHKTVSLSDTGYDFTGPNSPDGLADVVASEWKQIIVNSIRELEPQHRAVLTMRCYDQMAYSEIAKIMGRTEFGVRMLFYRAKKALAKKLNRHGLGKTSLLPALVLFGKLTATSEAAAANLCITPATVKVGMAAFLAVMATSKIAIISLATVGLIAVGSVTIAPGTDKISIGPEKYKAKSFFNTQWQTQAGKTNEECWYYYPPKANGAVMMQLKSNPDGKQSYYQWLQNDQANYYKCGNTVYINNYRMWTSDLSVWQLPTDSPQLRDFLTRVEGKRERIKYVPTKGDSLMVIVKQNENSGDSQITYHYDVSDEECFRYSWPAGAKIIDNRDTMHKRGWTYFRIAGRIGEEQIQGTGRIPFVYATSKQYYPWLRLKLGDNEIAGGGKGELFKGLGQPWMGLHTIDTIRRAAAEEQIWFETKLLPDNSKAEVVLSCERTKLVYTIDMEKDVIDKIKFSGDIDGELRFSYLQDIDDVSDEFSEPRRKSYQEPQQEGLGILWLMQLAEGNKD